MADVVECHRGLSEYLVFRIHRLRFRQVENGPEQHGGMTVRQHKPIAIGPDGTLRIKTENAIPKRIDEWSERHRRTRVSGLGIACSVLILKVPSGPIAIGLCCRTVMPQCCS